jgi:hypothetical protein
MRSRSNNQLQSRVRTLESRLLADPVILHFADGSTGTIPSDVFVSQGLVAASFRGAKRTPKQTALLDLIRQTEFAEEPGGAHMVEVIKVLLDAAEVDPSLNPELDAIG